MVQSFREGTFRVIDKGLFDDIVIIEWSTRPRTKVATKNTCSKVHALIEEEDFEASYDFHDYDEVDKVTKSITRVAVKVEKLKTLHQHKR